MGEIIKIAQKKDVPVGHGIPVDVKGKMIALFNVAGEFYAIDDECTHAGGSLGDGTLEGHVVTCPWHEAKFDVKNGQVVSDPAEKAVQGYKVRVEGEDIQIEI